MRPFFRNAIPLPIRTAWHSRPLPGSLCLRTLLLLAVLAISSHALYRKETITAFRVPNGKIVVDGKAELLWRALSVKSGAVSSIPFSEYEKLVLLQPENVRNADPSKYIKTLPVGNISMLAAYDSSALYLLFVVKTKTVVNSESGCFTAANLWKLDAPDVYLDPSAWSDDSTTYQSYFAVDAGGLIFGTSPKTIELAKPLSAPKSSFYFRNRATGDKFQSASPPSGAAAVSLGYPGTRSGDSSLVVEMKIPYWGGLNMASKSAFISWGFNLFPDSLWDQCGSDPLAFRWAKHYVTYDAAAVKPPGWRKNDSTHYDPTRSWDGWGKFSFSSQPPIDSSNCQGGTDNELEFAAWKNACQATVGISRKPDPYPLSRPWMSQRGIRDIRGRLLPADPSRRNGTGANPPPEFFGPNP
jgi:hypothetical protein